MPKTYGYSATLERPELPTRIVPTGSPASRIPAPERLEARRTATAAARAEKAIDEDFQIRDLGTFPDGTRPIEIVSALPALPDPAYPQGAVVFLTTDNKLYRSTGAAWTLAVAAVDITGQITGTQIADDSISTPKLQANSVITAKISAGAVTANEIAADAVTTNKILAGAVTAAKMNVTQLSAISADLGTVTAGLVRDAASKFQVDLNNRLVTIIDEQATPQTRVKLGELGVGAADWGMELYGSDGSGFFRVSGTGIEVLATRLQVHDYTAGETQKLILATTGTPLNSAQVRFVHGTGAESSIESGSSGGNAQLIMNAPGGVLVGPSAGTHPLVVGTDPVGTELLRVGGTARFGDFVRIKKTSGGGVVLLLDGSGSSGSGGRDLFRMHLSDDNIVGTLVVTRPTSGTDLGLQVWDSTNAKIGDFNCDQLKAGLAGGAVIVGTDPTGTGLLRVGGNIVVGGDLRSKSATDLVLSRDGTTKLTLAAALATFDSGVNVIGTHGFFGGTTFDALNSNTVYMSTSGVTSTEAFLSFPVPFACTISDLYVEAQVAPGVGGTFTYTLRKNGAATSVVATITGTNTTGSDTTNSASYAAGDLLSIEVVRTSTTVTTRHKWGAKVRTA